MVFPHPMFREGGRPIQAFAQSVERAGFEHLCVYDHVLGADPSLAGWRGAYDYRDPFHEVFVLLGYLAACTNRIQLTVDVLVLPQRQAALAAKQAAEVAVLSNSRLRLGIGVGWNRVEYLGLESDFRTRGRRIEQQVRLLTDLWSQDLVELFESEGPVRLGLNPRPPQPIPIWFGGTADIALMRAARLGAGWMSELPPGPELNLAVRHLQQYLLDADHDAARFGFQGEIPLAPGKLYEAVAASGEWAALGATHLALSTWESGLKSVDDHVELLAEFKAVWDQGL